MWVCAVMSHPDENVNKMYRNDVDTRKKDIKTYMLKTVDWEDKLLKKCIKAYPEKCLSQIQKRIKYRILSDKMTEYCVYLQEANVNIEG